MPDDRWARRGAIRRRAHANLLLTLMPLAARSSGRLLVEPMGADAVLLRFLDVSTLVRRRGVYGLAARDVAVAIVCPDAWPFERAAALQALVLEPGDWAHPNSDGRWVCVDLAGIVPARLSETIYDVIRLRRMRLDHVLDAEAAAFVRSRIRDMPADPRPLCTSGAPFAGLATPPDDRVAAWSAADAELESLVRRLAVTLPCTDVSLGTLVPALPPLDGPAFLRLARCAGPPLDGARAAFLLRARDQLRACATGWSGGPGVAVDPAAAEPGTLRREVVALHHGLEALGDPVVARSYLELCSPQP
jgi:hypothetical protein